MQIVPEKDARTCRFHPFDLTKVWSHTGYPLIDVGGADVEVQKRHIGNCLQAEPVYGKGVADALTIALDDIS